jgi:transcriptional regulator
MKMSVEELERALKNEKKTKYELFLDENKDAILAMIEKGYSDSEIARAINVYLAKLRGIKRKAKKEGKEIEENLKNVPAFIPKKVINKYLKELRKEVNKGDVLKDRKVVDFDDV